MKSARQPYTTQSNKQEEEKCNGKHYPENWIKERSREVVSREKIFIFGASSVPFSLPYIPCPMKFALILLFVFTTTISFLFTKTIKPSFHTLQKYKLKLQSTTTEEPYPQIVSPFDNTKEDILDETKETFDLTLENVELVLDEMRPYLLQDGGNVNVVEIDGPVVRLELVGECGTCPSSTQTMKMGLEKGLKEKIPEIQEVVQVIPSGPDLTQKEVDVVLDSVRPFLSVAGGTIDCVDIVGVNSVQPVVTLNMMGASASLNSVKLEIMQRIQRHFMQPGLKVDWKSEEADMEFD